MTGSSQKNKFKVVEIIEVDSYVDFSIYDTPFLVYHSTKQEKFILEESVGMELQLKIFEQEIKDTI